MPACKMRGLVGYISVANVDGHYWLTMDYMRNLITEHFYKGEPLCEMASVFQNRISLLPVENKESSFQRASLLSGLGTPSQMSL